MNAESCDGQQKFEDPKSVDVGPKFFTRVSKASLLKPRAFPNAEMFFILFQMTPRFSFLR